jgi:A/G-specific adenine glycosylase
MIQALSDWYRRHHRKLPFRETHDPYRIWISEVMLQQTTVAAVIPYYHRFLEAFPTLKDLACAPEERVLALWSGLGYYSRARNLQKGAKYILENFEGQFPKTRDEILKVPGIGPYTAGAILSIAFDLKEPLVDGNVQRVFARVLAIDKPIEERAVQKRFWEEAKLWVNKAESPRVLNQAIMELGATICTKAKPACLLCPIRQDCKAFQTGRELELPVRRPKRKPVELNWLGLVYENKGRLWLRQNKPEEWWHGLWDFPRENMERLEELRKKHSQVRLLQRHKHTVTHHKIQLQPVRISLSSLKKTPPSKEGRWFSQTELESLPVSSLTRKVLNHLD